MTKEVQAHQLVDPDPSGELEFIEELLDETLETVGIMQDNLGADFHRTLRLLGYRVHLQRQNADIQAALESIAEYGVAHFERGRVGPDTRVSVRLCGQVVSLPGGVTTYHTASRWLDAVGAALCLRDSGALASLAKFKVIDFRGEYDEYLDHLVRALTKYICGEPGVDKYLAQAQSAIASAGVFPERAKRLGAPTIAVAKSVLTNSGEAFNERLADGLAGYRTLHKRSKHNHEAQSVIPLLYLGLTALAHDQGIGIDVASAYLPAWIVEGGG